MSGVVSSALCVQTAVQCTMQCVDGLLQMANLGIAGVLNVFVRTVINEPTFSPLVLIICQFTIEDRDIHLDMKDEIISGCIGAAFRSEAYHPPKRLVLHRNVVKHVPIHTVSPSGHSSSMWFTSMHIPSDDAMCNDIFLPHILIHNIRTIAPEVIAVSLFDLTDSIRAFAESFLHPEDVSDLRNVLDLDAADATV